MPLRATHRRSGFSLLELIVVLIVIALLAAIVTPQMSRVIGRSKDSTALQGLAAVSRAAAAIAALDERPLRTEDLETALAECTDCRSEHGPWLLSPTPDTPSGTYGIVAYTGLGTSLVGLAMAGPYDTPLYVTIDNGQVRPWTGQAGAVADPAAAHNGPEGDDPGGDDPDGPGGTSGPVSVIAAAGGGGTVTLSSLFDVSSLQPADLAVLYCGSLNTAPDVASPWVPETTEAVGWATVKLARAFIDTLDVNAAYGTGCTAAVVVVVRGTDRNQPIRARSGPAHFSHQTLTFPAVNVGPDPLLLLLTVDKHAGAPEWHPTVTAPDVEFLGRWTGGSQQTQAAWTHVTANATAGPYTSPANYGLSDNWATAVNFNPAGAGFSPSPVRTLAAGAASASHASPADLLGAAASTLEPDDVIVYVGFRQSAATGAASAPLTQVIGSTVTWKGHALAWARWSDLNATTAYGFGSANRVAAIAVRGADPSAPIAGTRLAYFYNNTFEVGPLNVPAGGSLAVVAWAGATTPSFGGLADYRSFDVAYRWDRLGWWHSRDPAGGTVTTRSLTRCCGGSGGDSWAAAVAFTPRP